MPDRIERGEDRQVGRETAKYRMVRYSIAICNRNMAETIERSIRSIADQIGEDYEIVVVDDGSTDGSLAILNDLAEAYPSLRIVEGDNQNLAEARNQSFEAARGEFVLESLDTDDVYSAGITDFVEIFEQLHEQLAFDFYLKGDSINMAPRDLLLEYPYRSLKRAEDFDLWKRLFDDEAIIWLKHDPFWEQIAKPETSPIAQWKLDVTRKIGILRSGTSLSSSLQWYLRTRTPSDLGLYYHLLTFTIAFPFARRRGIYETPPQFDTYESLTTRIDESSRTLDEIETAYDVQIDRQALSERGKALFCRGQ